MSLPSVPTLTTLITEAFQRSGVPAPSSPMVKRAEEMWLQEVLNDIQADKRWHAIEETMLLIPQPWLQVYPIPSPLSRVLRIRFYHSTITGTAQSGSTANTIKLAATEGASAGTLKGRKIFIISGTGAPQVNRITDYVEGTKVATVACNWSTTTSDTSVYMVATVEHDLIGPDVGIPLAGLGPTNILQYWEEWEAKLRFWPVPNTAAMALEIDGIVDLSLVDLADARYTRILREWRNAIVQGLRVKIFEDQDDMKNAQLTEQTFERTRNKLMVQDSRSRRRLKPTAMRGPGGLPR